MEEGNRLIEGKYRGLQTITLFDGININVVEKFLFLEIKKIENTPNTYLLFYSSDNTFDNINELMTLGNIIEGRLVNIAPSSLYSTYNLIDDKLVHNFFGIQDNIQKSGTGILERYY
jgi:hypothetical protein